MDLDYFGHATYALINEINISIIELFSMRMDNGINKLSYSVLLL